MASTIGAFGALFAATVIFLTGSGLLSTLLSTRMAVEGFSSATAGIVMSCYFSGLLIGSFVSHRLIQHVGHIRAFTIFEDQVAFVPMKSTSPMATTLDPRTDPEDFGP